MRPCRPRLIPPPLGPESRSLTALPFRHGCRSRGSHAGAGAFASAARAGLSFGWLPKPVIGRLMPVGRISGCHGPFANAADLAVFVADLASHHDPMAWAVRPISTGVASGWLTLMDIQPRNASIELGSIWFSPALQRTRAATEAMFLLLRLAADDLGYRRLVWKCDALNAPSRRAAERLGFIYEGTLRAERVVKGRLRDTAYFSVLEQEWPTCRDAIRAWLDPANFATDGTALRGLGKSVTVRTRHRSMPRGFPRVAIFYCLIRRNGDG